MISFYHIGDNNISIVETDPYISLHVEAFHQIFKYTECNRQYWKVIIVPKIDIAEFNNKYKIHCHTGQWLGSTRVSTDGFYYYIPTNEKLYEKTLFQIQNQNNMIFSDQIWNMTEKKSYDEYDILFLDINDNFKSITQSSFDGLLNKSIDMMRKYFCGIDKHEKLYFSIVSKESKELIFGVFEYPGLISFTGGNQDWTRYLRDIHGKYNTAIYMEKINNFINKNQCNIYLIGVA